jgi:hypothetical protein
MWLAIVNIRGWILCQQARFSSTRTSVYQGGGGGGGGGETGLKTMFVAVCDSLQHMWQNIRFSKFFASSHGWRPCWQKLLSAPIFQNSVCTAGYSFVSGIQKLRDHTVIDEDRTYARKRYEYSRITCKACTIDSNVKKPTSTTHSATHREKNRANFGKFLENHVDSMEYVIVSKTFRFSRWRMYISGGWRLRQSEGDTPFSNVGVCATKWLRCKRNPDMIISQSEM